MKFSQRRNESGMSALNDAQQLVFQICGADAGHPRPWHVAHLQVGSEAFFEKCPQYKINERELKRKHFLKSKLESFVQNRLDIL